MRVLCGLCFFSKRLFSSYYYFSYFSASLPLPPFLSPLLSQCDRCPDVPACVGAHGWVAGIASNGSVLLTRGWLVTVEAPGHPGHPPSTQLDAVVKGICSISNKFTH